MKLGFIIDRDHLADGSDLGYYAPRAGLRIKFSHHHPSSYPISFKAFDDDGILYYEGRASDEDQALWLTYEWLMNDSGVTYLEVNGEQYP